MVAIVSGNNLGLALSSLVTLGKWGNYGAAASGQSGEKAYVNVSNGNLVLSDLDDRLAGVGLNVATLRTYNSQGTVAGGWRVGPAQQLSLTGSLLMYGSSVTRTGADGSRSTYMYDSTQRLYISTDGDGAYNTITYDYVNGQFVWTDGTTGLKERYDGTGNGNLLSTSDPSGNQVSYFYNADNSIASVVSSSGETTYFDYTNGDLTGIRSVTTAANGTRNTTAVRYQYDASHRLTTVIVDLSPDDNDITDGNVYRTDYTYDGDSTRVASVKQSDGTSLTLTYVQIGSDFRVASVTDGLGNKTQYGYDTANRKTTVIDPMGQASVFAYDAQSQLLSVTGPAVGGVTAVRRFEYDNAGDVVRVTDENGNAIKFDYDAYGNIWRQTDALGNVITRTYDANNKLLTETTALGFDPATGWATFTATVRYVYDSTGKNQQRFVISPEGRVTEYVYNALGQRVGAIQYLGATYPVASLATDHAPSEAEMVQWAAGQNKTAILRTDMTYDMRGQLATRTTFQRTDANGAGIADGSQSVDTFVYDQHGQLLKTVNANSGATLYVFDGLGRLVATTDAAGNTITTRYDDANQRTIVTAANGVATLSTYDRAGHVTSVTQTAASGTVLSQTTYAYDADGRLLMTQDATGQRHWYTYDALGRKSADIDANGSVTEYRYDAAGNLVRTLGYATAVNVSVLSDASGKPTGASLDSLRPAVTASDTSSWRVYDADGRLVKTISATGAVMEMRYDGASRLVATVQYAKRVDVTTLGDNPVASAVAPAASSDDRLTRNFYTNDGKLEATIDADGYMTQYTYDAAGRQRERIRFSTVTNPSIRATGTIYQLIPASKPADLYSATVYDASGRIVGEISGGYLTERVYDARGNVTKVIRYANPVTVWMEFGTTIDQLRPTASANDQVITTTYDTLDRIVSQIDPEGTVTTNKYDALGNLIERTRAVGTPDASSTSLARYDVLGRLVAALSAEGAAQITAGMTQAQIDTVWSKYSIQYTYDAAGRRTSMTDALGNRTRYFYDADGNLNFTVNALGEVSAREYNALGQLVSTTLLATRVQNLTAPGGVISDADRALLVSLRNPVADTRVSYTYNTDGTLATETNGVGGVVTHAYDAFGQEVSRTTNNGAMSQTQVFTYDHRGNRISSSLDPAALNIKTRTEYDAFGRAVRTIDANGNATSYTYDALGRQIKVVDALDASHSTTYDAFDRVLTQKDSLGNVTKFSYDLAGRTTTVTTPDSVSVVTAHDSLGRTTTITDGRGYQTIYQYDHDGNLLTTADDIRQTVNKYDAAGHLIETEDPNGNKVVYTYDAAGRALTRTVDPSGLNLVTRYSYDAKGQQITVTDPNGTVTRTDFDNNGHISARVVDPGGLNLTTHYLYDQVGNVLTVVTPGGVTTKYEYDVAGRRTSETIDPAGLAITRRYAYDAAGNVVSSTDANGNVTRYFYDAKGQVAYTVDPLGNVVGNTYDGEGRVTRVVHYAMPMSAANLATAGTSAATLATLIQTSVSDISERRLYDTVGHLKYTVDGAGAVVRFTYDKSGNVTERLAYANRINLATWNGVSNPSVVADAAHDQAVRTVYDAINRPVYSVSAAGTLTAFQYDANGNIVDKIVYAKPVPTGTAMTVGALSTVAISLADAAHDQHDRNVYDAASRLTWSANGVGSVVKYVYDADGNLISQTRFAQAVGASTAPSSVVASDGDQTTRMTYDAAGRLVYQIGASGAVTMQRYDADGHVIERLTYATPVTVSGTATSASVKALVSANAANDRSTKYVFDAAGRAIFTIDASGAVLEATYDAVGHVVATRAYANRIDLTNFDPATGVSAVRSRLSADAASDRVTHTLYNADGQAIYQIDSLGFVTANTYDAFGRVVSTTQYGLAISATTTWTTAGVSGALVPSATLDRVTTMTYDATGHMLSTRDALGFTESYTYDGLGNKITFTNKKGDVWRYDYDAAGRLTTETAPPVNLTVLKTDASGNLVVDTANSVVASVVTRTVYDALGRVVSRTEAFGRPEARTTRYDYDAAGHQIKTTFPPVGVYDATRDNLVVNGANGLANRVDNLTELTSQTIYDALGNAVANLDVSGNWSYKTYDKLGNVIHDVDAMGYVTEYTRNQFGEVTRLTRYAGAVTVGNGAQAPTAAQVKTALAALPNAGVGDRVITTTYDQLGHTLRVVEPQSFVYDSSAGGSAQYFSAGRTTQNTYNAFGELVQIATLRNAVTNQWNSTYQYYDLRGQQVATVDAMGYVTTQAYDGAGNLTSHTEYANALAGGGWSLAAFGRPVTSSDDRTMVTTYDAMSRKLSETRVDVQYSTASDGSSTRGNLVTQYRYDAVGNLTTTISADSGTTHSYFDALGRLTATTGPVRNSGVSGAAFTPLNVFYRDAYGNAVMTVVRGNGAASANDATYVDAGASAADRTTMAVFDAHGKVLQMSDAAGVGHYSSYDAAGRLVKEWQIVTGNDGASHTIFKAYQYDKLGRQTHVIEPASTSVISNGAITTVSQAAAGVIDTAMEYNGFGEMIRRGIGGGRQEYFDYDGAGHLWRTNSGDGIDKVSLYDLDGHVTAEVRSAGAGGANYDMKAFASPDQVAGLSEGRRTDLVYDALGHVVSRTGAARAESAGGVTVRGVQATYTTTPATYGYAEDGSVVWNTASSVNFSWSLAQLGSGDIRVEFDYTTANVPVNPNDSNESGNESGGPTGILLTGVPRTRSQIFTNEQAGNGVSIAWSDANGTNGGISKVDAVRVYKKDVNGNWQLVINQNPSLQTVSQIEVGLPSNTTTNVLLQVRAVGTAGDGGWTSLSGVNFGDAYRFDTTGLAAGNYEYRVLSTNTAGTTQVTASGTMAVNLSQLASLSFPIGPGVATNGNFHSQAKDFTWQSAPDNVTQTFRYRVAGSNGAWSTMPIVHPYNSFLPGYDGFDMNALGAGTYEYELLWQRQGESTPYAHSTGSMTVVAATADQWVPPVNMPVINNVWVAYDYVGGSSTVVTNEDGTGEHGEIVGSHNANTIRWTVEAHGETAVFRYRVPGGAWQTLPVSSYTNTVSENSVTTLLEAVDISGLGVGTYEFEILRGPVMGSEGSHYTGTLTVSPTPAGHYETQTVPVIVKRTVTPPDPNNYITKVLYRPPVASYDENGVETLGDHYQRQGAIVVGMSYPAYRDRVVTETVTPPNPANYISRYLPAVYSSQVATYDEDGTVHLAAHYAWSGSYVVGLPYTAYRTEYWEESIPHQVPRQVPVMTTDENSGAPVQAQDEAGNLLWQTVYDTVYWNEMRPHDVAYTAYPPDPAAYMTRAPRPVYNPPVATGLNENGTQILAKGYAWNGDVAVAEPYQISYTVQDPYTAYPADPANFIAGYLYSEPVVTGNDENGAQILAPHYQWSNGKVIAMPYEVEETQYVQQQVWVPGVTPMPSIANTTPTYVPGYWIPGTPTQYGNTITTGSITTAASQPGQLGGVTVTQSIGANGGTSNVRPTINQTFDRWGNVLSISDPRSPYWVTTYKYNASNQIIEQRQPDANGNQSSASVVTRYTYDAMGRAVAVVDANGHVNGQTYDAAGNVTQNLHADGGVVRHYYDAFGQQVRLVDANGNATDYAYDKLGHLVHMTMGAVGVYAISGSTLVNQGSQALTQTYGYDQAGRKLWQTDGSGAKIKYDYDLHGNVVATTQPLGQVVRAAFDATNRKTGETDGNGAMSTWTYDYFGLLLGRTDIGAASYSYSYDNARQLLQVTNTRGQNLQYRYDAAGQNTSILDFALAQASTYAYDLAGNKVRERTVTNGTTFQDNHLAYDALGRLRDVADGRVHISIDYDAVGNRTHVTSHVINAMDQSQDEDRWFKYDAMNRQTVVDGINANGDIGVGQGHKITYDKNGNRTSDTYYGTRVQSDRVFDHTEWTSVWGVVGSDEAGNPEYGYIVQPSAAYRTQYTAVNGLTTEAYDYDSNNRLSHVSRDGVLLDTRFYDGANRVVQTGPAGALPQEYVSALNGAGGGNGSETRQSTYDQNGRLLHQKVTKSDGASKYEVNYSQYDGAGNVVSYSMANQDGDWYTNNYTYTMARFDGYKEARVDGSSDKFNPGSTTSSYDVNGNLTSVTDSTKPENNRTFVNDAQGHVLYVNQGGHTQRQLVVDGEVLGRYGDMINPNAPQDPNTGNPNFINKADFSFGFQPINGKYPTGAPGAVAVQSGDTLESIAHAAFGDSKLWYLIAEANGMSGNSDLRVGQTLTIPNRVSTIHNDNKTFKPYDPSAIVGDTTPNLPVPQADSGGGCGGFASIIMIAVTVVVAVYTAGSAAFAMGAVQAAEGAAAATASFGGVMSAGASAMLGGTAVGGLTVTGATIGGISAAVGAAAIGGVAGSLAGQLAGMAMGAQNGISFNQLALSGLSAGIGAGVGGQITGATIGASALRAAVTNVALQGVGVVTGLQSSFSWTSVAASAAGGAVGGALNAGGANSISQSINNEIGGLLGRTVSGVLVGAAAAATTSILRGGRIAIQQVATDAFGNALGQGLMESDRYSTEAMTTRATVAVTNQLGFKGNGSVMYGPSGNIGAFGSEPSLSDYATSGTSNGFDVDAAYGQIVDAFNQYSGGSNSYKPSILLASNGTSDVVPDYQGRIDEMKGWAANTPNLRDRGTYDGPRIDIIWHQTPTTEIDIGQASNGPLTFVDPETGVEGYAVPTPGQVGGLNADAIFQAENDAKVIAGTYNRLREVGDAFSAGQYGDAWRHATYEASPDARAVNNARLFPAPNPGAVRLEKMLGSSVGAGASLVANMLGASQRTQDALLDAGGAVEGIAGGLAGYNLPKAPQPGQAAAASRIRTRGNQSPVNALDVGKYGDLAPRSVGDGLSPDHMPSFAAVRTKVEGELGRPLTPTEATQLRNRTNTLVIGTDAHQEVSRTYGGRNTPAQIAKDASDLGAAVRRDQAVMEPRLIKEGYTQQQIDEAFERLHRMNRADGLY